MQDWLEPLAGPMDDVVAAGSGERQPVRGD
jgi:hypothetical protein